MSDTDEGLRREIIDTYGSADPYVNETHSHEKHTLAQLPVRLVYLPIFLAVGRRDWCFGIEVGPYTFDRDDVEVLREALAGYDQATRGGGQT